MTTNALAQGRGPVGMLTWFGKKCYEGKLSISKRKDVMLKHDHTAKPYISYAGLPHTNFKVQLGAN